MCSVERDGGEEFESCEGELMEWSHMHFNLCIVPTYSYTASSYTVRTVH